MLWFLSPFDVESFEPEVKILSLAIVSPDRPDIILPVPENGTPNGLWFTLKEGSHYRLRFTFQVSNNIVLGLKYMNTVWKAGIKGKFCFPRLCTLTANSRHLEQFSEK